MTQQEFETRTNIAYNHGEFDDIVNPIYMAAGQMDKDAFCAEFKKHANTIINSRIVSELVAEVETLRGVNQNYKRQLEDDAKCLQMFTDNIADFLIDMAEKSHAAELRTKAIDLIGEREYLRRKVQLGYELWKADRDALDEILKQD